MTVRLYSTTPASNNSAPPNGWPEGQAASTVNDCARQLMAEVRETFEESPYFDWGDTPTRIDNDTFTVATDLTARYAVGTRVKLVGATTGYGRITGSAFVSVTTIDVLMDSGNVPVSLARVAVTPVSTFGTIQFATLAASSVAGTPTWTDQHTYTNTRTGAGVWPILISAAAPAFGMTQTGAAANNGKWYQYVTSEQLRFAALADNELTDGIWMQVDRTGTTVDTVRFPTTTVNAFVVGTPFTGAPEPAMVQMNPAAARPALHIKNNSATVPAVWIGSDQTGGNVYVQFFDANDPETSTTGSISTNGTSTTYSTTSDAGLKQNFKPAPSALALINSIQIESFDWKKNGEHVEHGVVAQRLYQVAPYAVTTGDIWQVDKSTLIPAIIKYIQEQDQRIRALEERISGMN